MKAVRRARWTLVAGVLVVLCALSVASLAGASTSRSQEAVTISFVDRITAPSRDQYIKWLVDTFNERNEGKIEVKFTGIPVNSFWTKMPLLLKSSNPPDVFFSYEGGWAKEMVASKWAEPLDRYYKSLGWNTTLSPAAKDLATFGGHQWFLPWTMGASVVWYNTELFKKYGLKPAKTWTQFLAISEKLKANDVAPLMLANQQQWEAQFNWSAHFVNKWGLKAYRDVIDRKIPWTDRRVVDTFAEMKRQRDAGLFLEPVNGMDYDSTADIYWKRDDAAMWYQGSFILGKFVKDGKLTEPLNWFPYPQIGARSSTISVFAEDTFMMSSRSKNKAAAAELLKFIASREAQQKMAATMGNYAARKGVEIASFPPMAKKLGKLIASYRNPTFMHVDHAVAPEIWTPFLRELQAVLDGKQTPAKAAALTEQAARKKAGPVK
jgi:raffinose/stachyose/melibiose transport system substrate-binding protein